MVAELIPTIAVSVIVIIALVIDVISLKIPNKITVPALVAGLIFAVTTGGLPKLGYSFVGSIIGFTMMYILYRFKAVGAGDVKLFAALGSWTGAVFVCYSAVYSILYAGLLGVCLFFVVRPLVNNVFSSIVTKTHLSQTGMWTMLMKQRAADVHIPFMITVVPGVVTAWYSMAGGRWFGN